MKDMIREITNRFLQYRKESERLMDELTALMAIPYSERDRERAAIVDRELHDSWAKESALYDFVDWAQLRELMAAE